MYIKLNTVKAIVACALSAYIGFQYHHYLDNRAASDFFKMSKADINFFGTGDQKNDK